MRVALILLGTALLVSSSSAFLPKVLNDVGSTITKVEKGAVKLITSLLGTNSNANQGNSGPQASPTQEEATNNDAGNDDSSNPETNASQENETNSVNNQEDSPSNGNNVEPDTGDNNPPINDEETSSN